MCAGGRGELALRPVTQPPFGVCPRPLPLQILKQTEGAISIRELSEMTSFKTDDIISTLQVTEGGGALAATRQVGMHRLQAQRQRG